MTTVSINPAVVQTCADSLSTFSDDVAAAGIDLDLAAAVPLVAPEAPGTTAVGPIATGLAGQYSDLLADLVLSGHGLSAALGQAASTYSSTQQASINDIINIGLNFGAS